MNENIRRLLKGVDGRLTATSEIDQAGDRALIEALGISDFDIAQSDQGHITGPVAALHDAIAEIEALAGASDTQVGKSSISRAQADGDLSQSARKVARWLDRNGDGEIRLQAVASNLHMSQQGIRDALDELMKQEYVDLRPSVRTGAIRVQIMR
jgi:hypothetical protein